jgi:alkyl sulfatase BDS1-like metallo-beta-lactamase superfamily hydrolase
MEEAVSENIIAGAAMRRRAGFMYGNNLPKGPKGFVGVGLGTFVPNGTVTLIPPTDHIKKTGETRVVDGIEIEFMMANGAEAPVEMMFYFPKFKAICQAEICSCLMHNVYTLRGAKLRDATQWSTCINEAMLRFGGKSEVSFGSHNWPRWGKDNIRTYMKGQRDMYKHIHDQTLRLANHGYCAEEIAEVITLPKSISREFYNRGYYGTIKHNSRAVYNFYLGFFNGNPSTLDPLPPVEASVKMVEYMGGAAAVMQKAQRDFEDGNYRWVCQVLNHVVFADPTNQAARLLLALTLEQLGYQAESAPWRNFYLRFCVFRYHTWFQFYFELIAAPFELRFFLKFLPKRGAGAQTWHSSCCTGTGVA